MRRRVVAGLGAFILMAALVAFPLRARAMSAAAVAASVGGATLIAAYMAACGIYPYSEDGQSFGEWGARALTDLVEQYNQNRLERQIQIAQLTGYVAGRTIAIARDTWDKLREFVNWCRETFSLADNQAGGSLGVISSDSVPWFDFAGASSNSVIASVAYSQGIPLSNGWAFVVGNFYTTSSPSVPILPFLACNGNTYRLHVANKSHWVSICAASSPSRFENWAAGGWTNDFSGGTVYIDSFSYGFKSKPADFPVITVSDFDYSSRSLIGQFAASLFDSYSPSFSGITVDTSTVSIPAELSEDDDTEWVGLSVYPGTVTGVAGTGTTTETGGEAGGGTVAGTENPATVLTPQAVERIIQQGVEARQRPDVRPVEVEVGEGVTVDEETGELVAAEPGTVVITETDIPLSLGDYAIPSLSTVFPFSIPWDIMRVWQALDAEPRFPLQDFSMTLSVPWLFGDSPPTVRFGLDALGPEVAQKMDELAFMVRSFLLVIACVGFLVFISQFIKF